MKRTKKKQNSLQKTLKLFLILVTLSVLLILFYGAQRINNAYKVSLNSSANDVVIVNVYRPFPLDQIINQDRFKYRREAQHRSAFIIANNNCYKLDKKKIPYLFLGKIDALKPSFINGQEFAGNGNHTYDHENYFSFYKWKYRFICAESLDRALIVYNRKTSKNFKTQIDGIPLTFYSHSFKNQLIVSNESKKKKKLLSKLKNIEKKENKQKKLKSKIKKVEKNQPKLQKITKYNQSELELIKRFKNYEKNCEPVESKVSSKVVTCIKITDVLDLGKFREIQSFPEGMLKNKLNWAMLSKKAGKEVYSLFVKRGPQYHAKYPGAMILGMSWYEIFYLNQLKKNKKVIERFVTFGPDNYNKYNNPKDPINSIKAKNFPKKLFQSDVFKISKLINKNKSKIKMREALGFSNEDKVEDVIKGQWILGTFLNNDKLKVKKVKLDPELKKRKILIARYKTALTKYKKKLEEKTN